MTNQEEPYGLAFGRALPAEELEHGTIIVLDGHVLERTVDADDPDRVRLVITPALGPPPGRDPDRRDIVITAPSDMMFSTARPQNIELAPPPSESRERRGACQATRSRRRQPRATSRLALRPIRRCRGLRQTRGRFSTALALHDLHTGSEVAIGEGTNVSPVVESS